MPAPFYSVGNVIIHGIGKLPWFHNRGFDERVLLALFDILQAPHSNDLSYILFILTFLRGSKSAWWNLFDWSAIPAHQFPQVVTKIERSAIRTVDEGRWRAFFTIQNSNWCLR